MTDRDAPFSAPSSTPPPAPAGASPPGPGPVETPRPVGAELDLYDELDGATPDAPGATVRTRVDATPASQTLPGKSAVSRDWIATLWEDFPHNVRDRYRQGRLLGEGGMGVVLEAQDREMGRPVALKGLKDPSGSDPHERRRQVEEARIAAGLPHPNILPVYDMWTDRHGNPWYSMLRVPGEAPTLGRRLRELEDCRCIEERPLGELFRTFLQICSAMAQAHAQGIVHRDLKPENIFLGPTGEALVADWGVAASLEDRARLRDEIVGSPGYASPEQLGALGPVRADPRSDIYSLGVILYEIVVGRPLFSPGSLDGRFSGTALAEVLQRGVEIPQRVGRELRLILERATALDPEDRYPDVRALMRDLETSMTGGVLEGLEYSPRERFVRWVKARPGLSCSLVTTAAFMVLFSLGLYLQERETRDLLARARLNLAQVYAQKARAAWDRREDGRALHYSALALETSLDVPVRVKNAPPLPPRIFEILARVPPGGRLIWTLRPDARPLRVALHPGGIHVALALADGTIRIFDMATGEETRRFAGGEEPVNALAFLDRGRTILSGDEAGRIRSWRTEAAESGETPGHDRVRLVGREEGPIRDLALSTDGTLLSSLAGGKRLRFWSLDPDGTWKARPPYEVDVPGAGAMAYGTSEGFSTCLAVGSSSRMVHFWETKLPEQPGPPPEADISSGDGCYSGVKMFARIEGFDRPVTSLAFSPGGRFLAATGLESDLRVWDLPNWKEIVRLELDGARIRRLRFDAAGNRLLGAGDDGVIRVWEAPAESGPGRHHRDVGRDHHAPGASSAEPFREARRLAGHVGAIVDLDVSPDGTLVVSVGEDGTLRLWDAGDPGDVLASRDPGDPGDPRTGAPGPVLEDLRFVEDGRVLTGTDPGGRIHRWDFPSRQELASRAGDPRAGDISGVPAGRLPSGPRARVARPPWNPSPELTGRLGPMAHAEGIWARHRETLVLGTADGELRVWSGKPSALVTRVQAHAGKVTGLTFRTSTPWLVSSGADGVVRTWSVSLARDPAAVFARIKELSSFGHDGLELVPRIPAAIAPPRYPPRHPFRWLRQAGSGDPRASWRVARGYLDHLVVIRNGTETWPLGWDERARALLRKAAAGGHQAARLDLELEGPGPDSPSTPPAPDHRDSEGSP